MEENKTDSILRDGSREEGEKSSTNNKRVTRKIDASWSKKATTLPSILKEADNRESSLSTTQPEEAPKDDVVERQ